MREQQCPLDALRETHLTFLEQDNEWLKCCGVVAVVIEPNCSPHPCSHSSFKYPWLGLRVTEPSGDSNDLSWCEVLCHTPCEILSDFNLDRDSSNKKRIFPARSRKASNQEEADTRGLQPHTNNLWENWGGGNSCRMMKSVCGVYPSFCQPEFGTVDLKCFGFTGRDGIKRGNILRVCFLEEVSEYDNNS